MQEHNRRFTGDIKQRVTTLGKISKLPRPFTYAFLFGVFIASICIVAFSSDAQADEVLDRIEIRKEKITEHLWWLVKWSDNLTLCDGRS